MIEGFIYGFCENFAFLALSALGMAVIYGMMGITNLAHGEFMMIGAYVTALLVNVCKIPLIVAVLAASVVTGAWGLLIDRTIIKRLYDRPLDSIVATWGISLVMTQAVFIMFGSRINSVATPLGNIRIGERSYSIYHLLLVLIAVAILAALYFLFNHTRFGLHSRATMQDRVIAGSLGINSNKMNAVTFFLGSALAGLAGGLYAPTMMISPTYGSSFLMQAFVAVIVGGANPLMGTLMSALGLSFVQTTLSMVFNTLIGKVGMLVMAIIVIRVLPGGFSTLLNKRAIKVKKGMSRNEKDKSVNK